MPKSQSGKQLCLLVFSDSLTASLDLIRAAALLGRIMVWMPSHSQKLFVPCALIVLLNGETINSSQSLGQHLGQLVTRNIALPGTIASRISGVEVVYQPGSRLLVPVVSVSEEEVEGLIENVLTNSIAVDKLGIVVHFVDRETLGVPVVKALADIVERYGSPSCPALIVVTRRLYSPNTMNPQVSRAAVQRLMGGPCGDRFRYEEYMNVSATVLTSTLLEEAMGDVRFKITTCIPNDVTAVNWALNFSLRIAEDFRRQLSQKNTRNTEEKFFMLPSVSTITTSLKLKGVPLDHAYIVPCTRIPALLPEVSLRLYADIVFAEPDNVNVGSRDGCVLVNPIAILMPGSLSSKKIVMPRQLKQGQCLPLPQCTPIPPCTIRSDQAFVVSLKIRYNQGKQVYKLPRRIAMCLTQAGIPNARARDVVVHIFENIEEIVEKVEHGIVNSIKPKHDSPRNCRITYLYAYRCPLKPSRLYLDITVDCAVKSLGFLYWSQNVNSSINAVVIEPVQPHPSMAIHPVTLPCIDQLHCPVSYQSTRLPIVSIARSRVDRNCGQGAVDCLEKAVEQCLHSLLETFIGHNVKYFNGFVRISSSSISLQRWLINSFSCCMLRRLVGCSNWGRLVACIEQLGSKTDIVPVLSSYTEMQELLSYCYRGVTVSGSLAIGLYSIAIFMLSAMYRTRSMATKSGYNSIAQLVRNIMNRFDELVIELAMRLDEL